jgi:RNA polymerase sigma factor for flagellar operon FliA
MQTAELLEKYQETKDIKYRNDIIKNNIGMVYTIAKNSRCELEYFERISAGTIGFMRAVELYNPKSSNKFISYAWHKIQGAIFDEARKNCKMRRTEIDRQKSIKNAEKILKTYNVNVICNYLNITKKQYYTTKYAMQGDSIYDETEITTEDNIDDKITHDSIVKIIQLLPERDKRIIVMYYYERLTQKEIADIYGCTQTLIKQSIDRIIVGLRKVVANNEAKYCKNCGKLLLGYKNNSCCYEKKIKEL